MHTPITPADIQNTPACITAAVTLPSGAAATFRPLASTDARILGRYFLSLSDETIRRYGPHPFDQATADDLCASIDPSDTLRMIATLGSGATEEVIAYFILKLGVTDGDLAHYDRNGIALDPLTDCTLAPSVADAYQSQGVGSLLMPPLKQIARRLGHRRMVLMWGVQATNARAVHFYEKHGFRHIAPFEDPPGRINYDMLLDLTTPKRLLTPVPFTRVAVEDEFWAPRIETNRVVTIPAEYAMCETTGRIAALDLTWKAGDPNPPHIFWDSDVAKWIEAASYSLAAYPDSQLDALLDVVIDKIARAQQPDGYVNTHYTVVEPDNRWTNLRDCHELYCAGHLIEAAVAHYQATGKRTLLDVLCRYADHIDRTFGRESGKQPGYCGHEEIELALVKLYHATGESRYLKLAQYFVDERGCVVHEGAGHDHYYDLEARARGEDPRKFWAKTYAYMQALMPVREQTEVAGHAVRAMYLFSAMADLANESGDAGLLAACERLWTDLCDRRMYLTGGIGPSASNEGFTEPYDLPDETAYAETCAAVGLVFWAHRMLQFDGNGRYADVMERALYNGTLSGVSLDGRRFFYENPLASRGNHHRRGWFDCACCPPNIARLIASVGGYAYSEGARDAWVHLYVQGQGKLRVGGADIMLDQETRYPWDGRVRIKVEMESPADFALHLRVPGWCERWTLAVNGDEVMGVPHNGYVALDRRWSPGDVIELTLAMPVELVRANPRVQHMLGRVALQRGPVVYCLEGCDHGDVRLDRMAIQPSAGFESEWQPDLLGGVAVLRGQGVLTKEDDWDGQLYRAAAPAREPISLQAIPYYAWDNRAPGEMRVWFRTEIL